MNNSIMQWAHRNNINYQALAELRHIFNLEGFGVMTAGESEGAVSSVVRLEAARKGLKLWRNNVGVMLNPEGQPVRYGLANDSKRLNEKLKSSDLIGWRPVVITKDLVGSMLAQFVSRECKRVGWNYTGTDREQAQLRWLESVTADGGDACFTTGEGTL